MTKVVHIDRLRFIAWEFGADMREITQNSDRVKKNLKSMGVTESDMRHLQAVGFFNNSILWGTGSGTPIPPKCRFYVKLYQQVVLLIPQVSQIDQISAQLQVNMWISKNFSGLNDDIKKCFDDYEYEAMRRNAAADVAYLLGKK